VEGQSPFRRESPLTTLAAVVTDPLPEPRNAGALAPVLQALMAKEPQERPGASDVLRMLEDVAAGHTTNITLGSLGMSPLRTSAQAVPAVDWPVRREGRLPGEGGFTPTGLGTVAAKDATDAAHGPRPTSQHSSPTPRLSFQAASQPFTSGSPRIITGPLYAEPGAVLRRADGPSTARESAPGSDAGPPGVPSQDAQTGVGTENRGGTALVRPRQRRHRTWTWLLIAVLFAGCAAGSAYWLRHHLTGRYASATGATTPPSDSGSASASRPTAAKPPAPSGYLWTTDPDGGFSFALPARGAQPWVRDAGGGLGRIDYTPDRGEHLIRFGVTLANPRTAMQQARYIRDQEQTHDHTFKQVEPLVANTYKGQTGTQMEFTYNDAKTGELRHELEQFWKTPNGNEYDFLVSYPATDWTNGYKRFEAVLQTFTVPSSQ
jgi:hypothetical protein